MMQSAFKPEGQVQTSVDPGPMNYKSIMTRGYPFVPVRRINVNDPTVNLEYEVQSRCVDNGEPVVLEGFHLQEKWNADIFTFPYLQAKFGDEKILCRDLHNAEDVDLTMAQYIETVHGDSLGGFAFSSIHPNPSISGSQETLRPRKPLIYAKDLTCPSTWRNFLMNDGLPPFLAYMRENDLNNLNTELAAENLMVYIGQAGTWTPAHIDQCGAIGHNIMTWADKGSSSIWFMIRSKDKKKAEELWSSFGQPLDYEGYFADLDELQRATFPIYVVQQKIGDFVMVPSQCVHQVVNLGKATIKVSWNRLTPNCLKAAMTSVLPRYRQIGRPEGYRIKVIITSTLKAWTEKLETQEDDFGVPKDNFSKAFKEVLELYRGIVEEEWVDLHAMGSVCEPFERPKRLKESHHSQPAICDFCQADIWNRQFQCRECVDGEDAYDLCAQCYSLGRGCEHRKDRMDFVENFSMESCRLAYCRALAAWNQSTALSDCPSHEPIVDTWFEKIVPSTGKDFSSTSLAYTRHQFAGNSKACHICRLKSRTQMSAECSSCPLSFCELCLYKYYDALWTDIVGKQSGWKCFRCQGVCPCAQIDKRAATGCVPPETSHAKSLWFTRPEDDYRNHGGVSDDLGPSEQENVALGEDGWIERPQIAHGSYISKRTKPRPVRADDRLDASTFQRRRSLTPGSQSASTKKDKRLRSAMDYDDDGEWNARPKAGRGALTKRSRLNQVYTDDLSDTNSPSSYRRSLITRMQPTNSRKSRTKDLRPMTSEAVFTSYLGEEQELVRTTAVKAGLTRTLASLSKLQLAAGMTAYDVFELDKRCASLDPVLRASFRADLMEKRQQAHVATNEDAVGAKRPQKQLKEKEDMRSDDAVGKAGHHANSDEEAQDEISNKKRIQKHLKEKGETMGEDVAGKIGHHLQSDEEARKDTPREKRPQKRFKEKGETREDATGKARHHLQSDEEARDSIPNGRQPLKRFKNKGKAQEDAASEDRHRSHRDEEQENTHAVNVDGKRFQKHSKEDEEGAREVVAVDDRDSQTAPAPVKRKGAVSSQHPSRTRKLNKPKESLRRSPSPRGSQNKDRDDEESNSPPTHSSRSKRGQGAAATTLTKFEAKPKSPESEKKAAGSKKQSGFLNSAPDIPNHSFTETEHLENTGTRTETEIGAAKNEKATNILGSSRIVGPRNIDNEEHERMGVSLATQLFEPQAEDSSTTNVSTNQPSPTSPASPTTPTDAIQPPSLSTKEGKAFQEANTSTEDVTVSGETADFTLGTFQKTIEVFKETSSAIEETSSTTRETTFIIQETTPAPQIPTMRTKREIKPMADKQLTKAIFTATDAVHCTRSTAVANGTSNDNGDTVVSSTIQGAENANIAAKITATKINATNPTTTANTTTTNTTTTTTSTSTSNISNISVPTNVRKGPVKIVRSSPSQTIVKEIVDNSIKGALKLATTTTAAAQEQHLANRKHDHPPKSLLSLSSSLMSVSLISISSTDPSVNRPDDTTNSPITRSHRLKIEESGISRNIHMVTTQEQPIGRRTRMSSRT